MVPVTGIEQNITEQNSHVKSHYTLASYQGVSHWNAKTRSSAEQFLQV